MTATERFALPLLHAGQAQKELSHNEALTLIDAMLHPVVESIGADVPPDEPVVGQAWGVGPTPAGDWAGATQTLAIWTGGGWRFVTPVEGMNLWVRDAGISARFVDGGWQMGVVSATALHVAGVQVVGARQAAIAPTSGGAVVDTEARAAIAEILAALRAHGLIHGE